MGLFYYLGIVFLGGAFGGTLDSINRFKFDSKNSKVLFQGGIVSGSTASKMIILSSLLGIGGAVSIQFVMIGIGKFNGECTVENIVLLFSISLVAGFSGRKMLSLVSNKLEDQVGEAKRISNEALEEAEESQLLTEAIAMLGPHSTMGERLQSMEKLKAFLKFKPKERKVTILAGRIMRKDGNYSAALDVFSNFIEAKLLAKELDKDLADVLYNRSCYRLLSLKGVENEAEINIALDDLKKSIGYSQENKQDAKADKDFESVWDNHKFLGMTKD